MIIAITGGIGSGKSYVCQILAMRGIKVYDCDAHAQATHAHFNSVTKESKAVSWRACI